MEELPYCYYNNWACRMTLVVRINSYPKPSQNGAMAYALTDRFAFDRNDPFDPVMDLINVVGEALQSDLTREGLEADLQRMAPPCLSG